MDDRVFALSTVAISGGSVVASAIVTAWLTAKRERGSFKRAHHKDQLSVVRDVYGDALGFIVTFSNEGAVVDAESGKRFARMNGLLNLLGSEDVISAYRLAKFHASNHGDMLRGRQVPGTQEGIEKHFTDSRNDVIAKMRRHLGEIAKKASK